ncbi:MAG: fibronectin type III domain-containing protein [Acidobacteriota bacterium]
MTACGKRGAPLPPLVRVPAAPADFTVERRGDDVTLQFKVPAANTDGSRPANIERIDVYAFTGSAAVSNEQLVKFGMKVASLPVKAPRDPDAATESGEAVEEPDLEAEGLDQGAVAKLEDPLTPAAFRSVVLPEEKIDRSQDRPNASRVGTPLVGPPGRVESRIYVLVPSNKRGRKGSFSPRLLVPLIAKPETPETPAITYDESGVNVSWPPPPAVPIQAPATGDLLPGRYIGMETSTYAYHVYDVSPPAASETGTTATPQLATEKRLTDEAVAEPLYRDPRVEWGATRCYTVRTFETITGLTLQSDAAPPACVTLVDTFPPPAPQELQTVASEGAIDLIWEPSAEKDVTGYVVLRGTAPGGQLEEIKRLSAGETTFTDPVKAGVQYEYAVQAIDRAGNVSPMSNRQGDAAR